MTLSNPNSSQTDQQREAWIRIIRVIPARLMLHTLTLLAIVSLRIDLPPALTAIATSVGAEALINLLQRLAGNQNVTDEEIQEQIQTAIQDLHVNRILTENQRLIGRLFRRLDIIEFTIRNSSQEVSDSILNQLTSLNELVEEMQQGASLSLYPRPTRPTYFNIPIIGREEELSWLQDNLSTDLLLVGQPGSGKTYLLHHFIQGDNGYFVLGRDRDSLSNAIRLRHPQVLVVDDAHTEDGYELLRDLLQLRAELGVTFSIIASCWPSTEGRIRALLNLPNTASRSLERLDRDQIVNVINTIGIHQPTALVREIVNQATGLPGLAVTLSHLCLQGDVQQVALGEALAQSVRDTLEPWVGEDATIILAAIAVGGDAGLTVEHIANVLDSSRRDIVNIITRLSVGGVIFLANTVESRVSIRPRVLQYALIRDVFFGQPIPLLTFEDLNHLLDGVSYIPSAALSLIGAAALGANVPFELLTELAIRSNMEEIWHNFASLGPDHVNWVIDNYPAQLTTIASPALFHVPEQTIRFLLESAINDERALHSTPEHPLRKLQRWVISARRADDALDRRVTLWRTVHIWLDDGGDLQTGLKTLRTILSPKVEYGEMDPGRGNTYTISSGCLSPTQLRQVQEIWPEILEMLIELNISNWRPICDMVEVWAFNIRIAANLSEESIELLHSFARQMLSDLIPLAQDHPAVLHWANQIAGHLEMDVTISLDPIFETLYPPEGLRLEWQKQQESWLEAIRQLADDWCTSEPDRIIGNITIIESAAQNMGIHAPCLTPALLIELARRVDSPVSWLQATHNQNLSSEFIRPFMKRAIDIDESGWMEIARSILREPNQKWAAISEILLMANPPTELLEETLAVLEGTARAIETLFLLNDLSEEITELLLNHTDPDIASSAAWGEWYMEPRGTVREPLQGDWRRAVIMHEGGGHEMQEYRLREIFRSEPSIAFDWLSTRLSSGSFDYFQADRIFQSVVEVLGVEQRKDLLHMIPLTYTAQDMISDMVGDNLDLYAELLNSERLQTLQLAPLGGKPVGSWIDKALLALEKGYTPEQIARAAYQFRTLSWSGNESAVWQQWFDEFSKLTGHNDPRLRQVGEIGCSYASERQQRALNHERNEAIFGRDL